MRHARSFFTVIAAVALIAPARLSAQSDQSGWSAAGDNEWISVTGTVKETTKNGFTLKYDADSIVVELDDYQSMDRQAVRSGDRVTVTGLIDNDFHQDRTIEAGSVYIDRLDTYFYASASDEEDGPYPRGAQMHTMRDEWVSMTGTITGLTGATLELDTGSRTFSVDLSDAKYNKDIGKGDRVTVTGNLNEADLFERWEIVASSVILMKEG